MAPTMEAIAGMMTAYLVEPMILRMCFMLLGTFWAELQYV